MITEHAPAKINLALHVTGQRADGYHLLSSLVVFAKLGDVLRFEAAETCKLSVAGPLAAGVPRGGDNLVLRAAALFETGGAKIVLEKHLPHAAGIGGGSADAAATLRGLARVLHSGLPDREAILSLGADIPVCLSSKPQVMAGIGDLLSEPPALPPLHAVLVNPHVSVPTGAVFAGLAQHENPALAAPDWQDFDSFIGWLSQQRNDLEPPARALAPEIGDCLDALSREDVALARMSGSGATCFGLVETRADADRIARRLQAARPDWWIRATTILS